eukprot:26713-Prymnesium_polylepis.1
MRGRQCANALTQGQAIRRRLCVKLDIACEWRVRLDCVWTAYGAPCGRARCASRATAGRSAAPSRWPQLQLAHPRS